MPTVKKVTGEPKPTPTPTSASGGGRSGISSRIVPVAEYDRPGVRINIYGRNGTGKTTLACSFPKPLLLVGFEDGTRSVTNVKGVDFIRMTSSKDCVDLAKFLGSSKYASVVVDTATSLQDIILMELLGLDSVPVQLGWGTVSQTQYRQRSEKTREVLRLFLTLNQNVVILAQEKDHTKKSEEDDAKTDTEVLNPFMASSLGSATCSWLHDCSDYICQTYIREKTVTKEFKVGDKVTTRNVKVGGVDYCLRTLPHPMYASKLRVPRGKDIPECIVDPDYKKLLNLIS